MNRLVFSLTLAITTIVTTAVATTVSLTSPAKAQTAAQSASPLADFQTQPNDPFSSRGNDGSNSGMMNLLQQAMLGPLPDAGAFAATNRELVQDAATAFRAKQMLLLKARSGGQQPGQPSGQPSILLPGTGTLMLPPTTAPVLPAAPVTP